MVAGEQRLAGGRAVYSGGGNVTRGVSLSMTLGAGRYIPHPLAPLPSPRTRFVAPSRWRKAGQPRPNEFSRTCQRSRERERRTRSLDRLRSCPFEPGSSSGGQDDHLAGISSSVVLGRASDALSGARDTCTRRYTSGARQPSCLPPSPSHSSRGGQYRGLGRPCWVMTCPRNRGRGCSRGSSCGTTAGTVSNSRGMSRCLGF